MAESEWHVGISCVFVLDCLIGDHDLYFGCNV